MGNSVFYNDHSVLLQLLPWNFESVDTTYVSQLLTSGRYVENHISHLNRMLARKLARTLMDKSLEKAVPDSASLRPLQLHMLPVYTFKHRIQGSLNKQCIEGAHIEMSHVNNNQHFYK